MGNDGKIQALINTAQDVVNTLSIADWIGVTTFNDKVLNYNDTLVRASSTNKVLLNNFLSNLTLGADKTNYELALTTAFNMLATTFDEEDGITCNTIIIFITNGIPNEGEQNPEILLSNIDELDNYNTIMFTFGLGTNSNSYILQHFACNFNGIYQQVVSPGDLPFALSNYSIYIAAGLTRTSCIWTEPYIDALGLGWVTTVAYPIYDKSVIPPFLIAVAAMDLLESDLKQFGDNSEEVLSELILRSEKCTLNLISECQLESLRGRFKCNSTNDTCDPVKTTAPLCENFNKIPYRQGSIHMLEVDINTCCGNFICQDPPPTGIIVLVVLGGVGVILLCVFIVRKLGCFRKRKDNDETPVPSQTRKIEEITLNYKQNSEAARLNE